MKRWNEKADMVPRWMASGLLWAEAGFGKVRHAGDLPRQASTLALESASSSAADAASSPSAPSASAGQNGTCQALAK